MRSRANEEEQQYFLNSVCSPRQAVIRPLFKKNSVQKTSISKMGGSRALEPTKVPWLQACAAAIATMLHALPPHFNQ